MVKSLTLQDIIAIDDLRELMKFFHESVGLFVGILDVENRWLIAIGWQDICKNFHRVHPHSHKNCLLCEDRARAYLRDQGSLIYTCPNGLSEVVLPLKLHDRVLGHFFLGQFLTAPADLDAFRRRALAHDFDPEDYLAALALVPVVEQKRIDDVIGFFSRFFNLLMRVGAESQLRSRAENEVRKTKQQFEVKVKERTRELNQALLEVGDLAAQLSDTLKQVESRAMTDLLTDSYNRRKFDQLVGGAGDQEAEVLSFSLIMYDIDFFKKVNDRFGHRCGDEVLKHLCRLIRGLIRQGDLLIRWGGEEFLILLPETQLQDALLLAERVRIEVAQEEFPTAGHITISLGVAQFRTEDSIDSLLQRVDQALYAAKQQGRNRVVAGPSLPNSEQPW